MSNAKQHAEWLSLVEVSGPFLTLSVLNQSYQFGLDAHESDVYRSVKEAYQEWEDSNAPHIHSAWIRFLLINVLGYPADSIGEAQSIPESAVANLEIQRERIRPDLAILDPEDLRKVKLPILIYSRTQKLDAPVAGSSWSASPHSRMQLLLQNTGLQAGFVTNGAQWSLVHVRKGEPTGFATWQTILLTEEKLLLQAFKGLLGVEATLGAPDGKSLFDLLDKSAQDQEEVTKELGRQVRQAVEVFINAVDRLDQDSGRKLLAGLEPKEVYNGALTVMMRLIFLLSAEERGLMDERELYVQNYSVGALNDQLREIASGDEQVLEHRHDAWKRLLATFRLVHGGCNHENLNLPAYGGSLFDPAKYPYLEQCQIDNRVSLHLLDALEFLEIKVPGGGRETRRLSFRALGVEQIGHVYEGLLDHTAVRAEEAVVGLTGKETEEDEIVLSSLEANKGQIAKFFEKEKIKVSGNPEKLLQQGANMLKVSKLRVACGTDEELYSRTLPFVNIIREDSLEHLQVYPEGSIYVTAGADRRSSGTHYTPVSLTEEVVQYALEPKVYVGPAEGLPRNEWKLRSAKEIIDLKVCDIAMGSGAFLVQTCRYLSDRLVEAWQEIISKVDRPVGFSSHGNYFTCPIETDHWAKKLGSVVTTPIGELVIAQPSRELISDNPEERLAQARRAIADHCLYGVDINPMAVEMAKLSLWLTTMRRDRPFTFLDHALRVGDSLTGISEKQLENFSMETDGQRGDLLLPWVEDAVRQVSDLRLQLSRIPSFDSESIYRKEIVLEKANRAIQKARLTADMMLSEVMVGGNRAFDGAAVKRLEETLEMAAPDDVSDYHFASSRIHSLGLSKAGVLPFHWHLEFADVFAAGGFDAIVGNPPFLGGKKISGAYGDVYRAFLAKYIGEGRKGVADLSVFFLLKGISLIRQHGSLGLVTTSSIAEGDTREVGLDNLGEYGCQLIQADKNRTWPGAASVTFSCLTLYKSEWNGLKVLEGQNVSAISSSLVEGVSDDWRAKRLASNRGLAFIGTYILGTGFTLRPEDAQDWCLRKPSYKQVLFPFLSGGDMNDDPTHSAPRWIINFFDWPLDRTVAPRGYAGPVASDFPELLEIVRKEVKPLRDKSNRKVYRDRWWQFGEKAVDLYREMAGKTWVMGVASAATKYTEFGILPTNIVFGHSLTIVTSDDYFLFASLTSDIHKIWVREHASYNLSLIRYTPSDCLETFPFPSPTQAIRELGEKYHELRMQMMQESDEGLTATYNKFHSAQDRIGPIERLRTLHIDLDREIANAYHWSDLMLDHGFYETRQGVRYTICPSARKEVLRRLLKLNKERYEQEVKDGLHDKGRAKGDKQGKTTKSSSPLGPRRSLFDDQLVLGEES